MVCCTSCTIYVQPEHHETPTYRSARGSYVFDHDHLLADDLVSTTTEALLVVAAELDPGFNDSLVTTALADGWPEVRVTSEPVYCDGRDAWGCYLGGYQLLWVRTSGYPYDDAYTLIHELGHFMQYTSSLGQRVGHPADYFAVDGVVERAFDRWLAYQR
jgi:hypothetical protein